MPTEDTFKLSLNLNELKNPAAFWPVMTEHMYSITAGHSSSSLLSYGERLIKF